MIPQLYQFRLSLLNKYCAVSTTHFVFNFLALEAKKTDVAIVGWLQRDISMD